MSVNDQIMIAPRFKSAARAASIHFACSLVVAAAAAVLVFLGWYPAPFYELSGGLKLFLVLVSVDVVCGPLLTFVLFNPAKKFAELTVDMSLVALVQLAALVYGMTVVYEARPLFLVHEVDRFRVIALPDLVGADMGKSLSALDPLMRPRWFGGPVVVGIREPSSREERNEVLLDAMFGGRDYSQRPEFYIPYDSAFREKILTRAKSLQSYLEIYPDQAGRARDVLADLSDEMRKKVKIIPVLHKQEWVAMVDQSGEIIGYLPGDGFAVP